MATETNFSAVYHARQYLSQQNARENVVYAEWECPNWQPWAIDISATVESYLEL